ncbi:MAG: Glutamine--fructose-6-phosphate aminotransferase (isomerizing) [Firmicutes bacterium ADurb.Bin193]|nr:MAG: Glutamine--fructose-6-phosphate aminotransferase (isomerizing) [Firmicutes bacterium ADurb.Bin193]
MCGIVGYVGKQQAAPILLQGLSKLEYRGYDSAGVAVFDGDGIVVEKCKGRLKTLCDKLDDGNSLKGTLGIGHTRWATHGEPSDINSHPHMSDKGRIAVVHNGIIENYLKIKEYLIQKGYVFVSETDTEVIAHLADYYYSGDILDTVIKVINKLEGSYALGIICKDNPDEFIAVRKDSPLIIGLSEDGNFAASDIPAVLPYTRRIYLLEDKEIVRVRRDEVVVCNTDREVVQKEVFEVDWNVDAAEKGGYEHFMFKEIMEQPRALRDTVNPRIRDGKIVLDGISIKGKDVENIDNIYIVACGSAYHVGVVGKYIIEKLSRIHVEVDLASEFRYRTPLITDKTLLIVISQSGETADTIAALREGKRRGARVLSVVNVVGSTIARESDDLIYTWAGPEIAVATTKAYSTQLSVMYLLAGYFAQEKGLVSGEQTAEYIRILQKLPSLAEKVLENKEDIQYFASLHYNSKDVFFIGRGVDYAVSLEGSLKLKEISYIHSEAYAAGELKHGTISLIEEGTLVVALATQEALFDKMISNIKEVKARGAVVLALAVEGNTAIEQVADSVIYLPKCEDLIAPSLAVLPLQLFAYYISVIRACDVDKPRNLAKSVTVE